MSNEINMRYTLTVSPASGIVFPSSQSFLADINSFFGPTPGAVTVSVSGTDIDFSKLVTPGLCEWINTSTTQKVRVGVYEPDTDFFYPFLMLKPGEKYVTRLDQFLGEESTGTGTLVGYNSRIQARCDSGTVVLVVNGYND